MSVDVREVDDRDQWNSFLAANPRGHVLQMFEFADIHRSIGARVHLLGAFDRGRLVGSMRLSVAFAELPPSMRRPHFAWVYCARGPTFLAGPDSSALAALIERAHQVARREGAVFLRLEPNVATDDADADAWLAACRRLGFRTAANPIHPRRSWVLDIRPDLSGLLAGFTPELRRRLRRAERRGVTVRDGRDEADVDAFYEVLAATSRRHGFFIQDLEYYRDTLRRFASSGAAVVHLAEHEGDVVAGQFLIRLGDWCWAMFGGTSDDGRNLNGPVAMHVRSFEWAKARGSSYFDFRWIPDAPAPAKPGWGLYEFKRKFGGFSRLTIPSQDFVYRPSIYAAWQIRDRVRRALGRTGM